MKLGRLDREITLEFKTSGKSAGNEPTETWGSAEVVFARVMPLSGREYFAALGAQVVAEEFLVFEIRYRSDVRPGTARVIYEGRTYNIRRVAEVGRQRGMQVTGECVTA